MDAQAKAAKAQTEANKEVQKAEDKANAQVQEAAGAATAKDKDTSDSAIEARVRTAILGEIQPGADSAATATSTASATAPKDLKVSVDKGAVTLKGTVKSDAEKMDAEAKAKAVAGVTSVINQLEIKAE